MRDLKVTLKENKVMNIFKKFKKQSAKSLVAVVLTSFVALSALAMPLASAQQSQVLWEGWTKSRNLTAGQTEYTDVTNAKANDVVRVQTWHHNRENPAGPQASNVKVRFIVPSSEGTSHNITGISSADNAPTISDSTTINTAPESTTVEYIAGSAKFRYNKGAADGNAACETGFNYPPESCYATVALPDSVVTTGVNLDAIRGGTLRGCNAHHETVAIDVVVKKKAAPVKDAVCKAVSVQAYDNRRVTANVQGGVTNGQIVGYEINWGDGSTSTSQSAEHTYAQDGTYKIVTRVQVKFTDGETVWVTSAACTSEVTFQPGKPPVVPPTATTLPDTGMGSMLGIFAATSVAGTLAYRFVLARRFQ